MILYYWEVSLLSVLEQLQLRDIVLTLNSVKLLLNSDYLQSILGIVKSSMLQEMMFKKQYIKCSFLTNFGKENLVLGVVFGLSSKTDKKLVTEDMLMFSSNSITLNLISFSNSRPI